MARSDRLLRLMQALRCLPAPVTAARLAEETEVSLRSLYRDIAALRAAGAQIEGTPGFGYVLTEDIALPPQMLTRTEIEAVVLGLAGVRARGDRELRQAADQALAKIRAALPDRQQAQVLHALSLVYSRTGATVRPPDLSLIRRAGWDERALMLGYRDKTGAATQRHIYPLAIVQLDEGSVVLAWCCLRAAFRMFRTDRILSAELTGESFRPRRVALLREYLGVLRASRAAGQHTAPPLNGSEPRAEGQKHAVIE